MEDQVAPSLFVLYMLVNVVAALVAMLPAWAVCALVWTLAQHGAYVVTWAYYTYGYTNHEPPTLPRAKTVPLVAVNFCVVIPAFNALFAWAVDARLNTEFSLARAIAGLFMSVLVSVAVACHHYVSHRVPYLRLHVHGIHHRAVVTKSSNALYSHPLEMITGYQFWLVLACWLIDAHYLCTVAGILVAIRQSIRAHMTLQGVRSEHNLHHSHYRVNFGGFLYAFDRFISLTHRPAEYIDERAEATGTCAN